MKVQTLCGRLLLVVLALSSFQDVRAGWSGRGHAQVRPARQAQTPARPTARQAKPEEKPKKFKDLAVNTVFYSWTDRQQKRFPWVKISDTKAKAGTDPKATKARVVPVEPELQVFVEKPPSKDTTASKDTAGSKDTTGSKEAKDKDKKN